MTDTWLGDLLPALNLAVLEAIGEYGFTFATPAPTWLQSAFAAAAPGERHSLSGAFPFLDDFLHQARGAWCAGPHASIVSSPFTATIDGDELLLRASALTIGGRTVLVLERLVGAADTRPMLQKARQHALESERLVRDAARVHAPLTEAADAAAALAKTPLSSEQLAIVERVTTALDRLRAAAASLPVPPPPNRRLGR